MKKAISKNILDADKRGWAGFKKIKTKKRRFTTEGTEEI